MFTLALMKQLVFIVSFLFPFLAICQQSSIVVLSSSVQHIVANGYVGEDSFRYQYFLENNALLKIKNNETFQYKNIALGKIAKVDIQNPFKTVLFYESFNTAVILDNQLNEIQKINFSDNTKNIVATAVGMASQNNLWVFNASNQQIYLYQYLKNEYKNISNPIAQTIKYYQTSANDFCWIDNQNYSYSCDIFGRIIAIGKVPDFDALQFISKTDMIFKKNDDLFYYSLKEDKTVLINLDKKSYTSFYYKDQNLAIFTNDGITNYKINLP